MNDWLYLFVTSTKKHIVNGLTSAGRPEPSLAAIVRNDFHIDFLQQQQQQNQTYKIQ